MEVAMHFGDPFERSIAGGHWERQVRYLFIGQMLSPTVVRASGQTAVLGIRFQPAGLHAFCTIPKRELQNRIEPLDSVWPAILRRIGEPPESPQHLKHLDTFLLSCLRLRGDSRIAVAAATLSSDPNMPIDPLISQTGMSARTFRRNFVEQVGIGPKSFARIVRFQNALLALRSRPQVEAALTAGYYDQPHMVHEFQQLAGCPPSALLPRDGHFLQDSHSQSVL